MWIGGRPDGTLIGEMMLKSKVDSNELQDVQFKLYWPVVIWYVVFQLISDVTAGKVITLGPAVVSVTALYFPITYLISDILTEVYGFERARKALWTVMAASITAGLIYQVVVILPPGPGFSLNPQYAAVLGQVPRILVAGWIAVFAGDIANNFVMSKVKVWTRGHMLWFRAIMSTVVGQGLNTVIFYVGALFGHLPNAVLVQAILWGWAIKVGVEAVLVPVTYMVVSWMKRKEGFDAFDYHANYNPLKI